MTWIQAILKRNFAFFESEPEAESCIFLNGKSFPLDMGIDKYEFEGEGKKET